MTRSSATAAETLNACLATLATFRALQYPERLMLNGIEGDDESKRKYAIEAYVYS